MLTEKDKKEVVRIMRNSLNLLDSLILTEDGVGPLQYKSIRGVINADRRDLSNIGPRVHMLQDMREYCLYRTVNDLLDLAESYADALRRARLTGESP